VTPDNSPSRPEADQNGAQATESARSNSSSQPVSVPAKVLEWWDLFVDRLRRSDAVDTLFERFAEYDSYLKEYASTTLRDATILEIGFGARPYRLMALTSLGYDATGVDLDQPTLHGTRRELTAIYKRNGFERALKTLVRSTLFDARERRALAKLLRQRGSELVIQDDRYIVMDSTSSQFDDIMRKQPVDLIVSEDVFEHIPTDALGELVARMGSWLTPDGIALIRPNVFTGITGGHLVEWYPPVDDRRRRRSEPWEHLRKNRYVANTFLNKLTRADFRRLFSEHFDILEEHALIPDLGREYATPEVRAELREFSDEELFSNQVLFVLRPRSHDRRPEPGRADAQRGE